MNKIIVMAALFLLSVCVPVFAQDTNADTATDGKPVLSNQTIPENMETDNSELQDEGYGSDDAEYYGAEGENETVNNETVPAQ